LLQPQHFFLVGNYYLEHFIFFDTDTGLEELKDKWEELAPGFHSCFIKTHAHDFKSSLIESIRKAAHLPSIAPGKPLELFSANANESINTVVKQWVGFKKSNRPDFTEKLCSLVQQ